MIIINYENIENSIHKIGRKVNSIIGEVLRDIPFPWLIEPIARKKMSRYIDEINAWNEYTNYIATANISYELEAFLGLNISLCSSASRGNSHYRNLDWPIKRLKKWEVFKYINGPCGEFKTVGVPGLIGCLTGCAKKRFSISINADMECNAHLSGTPVALLIRQALEECKNYKNAVDFMAEHLPMRSSFVHIVSPSGQSSVVHMKRKSEVLKIREITNHHPDYEYFYDEELYEESLERLEMLQKSYRNIWEFPVYSDQTMQCVVMNSKTGEIKRGD